MNTTLLSMDDLIEFFGVNRQTIVSMIQSQGLPAFKIGRQWRVRQSDLDQWIEEQKHVSKDT